MISGLEKYAQLAGLLVLTVSMLLIMPRGLGLNESIEAAYNYSIYSGFVVLLIDFLIQLRSKVRSRLLASALWIGTFLAAMIALPFLFGGIQDLITQCHGFFGSDSSCIEVWGIAVAIMLFNPYVFLPLTAIIIGLSLIGIINKIRLRRS